MQKVKEIKNLLRRMYADKGAERVGFILDKENGLKVIEVNNIADKPEEGFMVHATDVVKYTELMGATGTWHTHPGASANLSGEDYKTFKMFPTLLHFIVGKDEIKCYRFDTTLKSMIEVDDEGK